MSEPTVAENSHIASEGWTQIAPLHLPLAICFHRLNGTCLHVWSLETQVEMSDNCFAKKEASCLPDSGKSSTSVQTPFCRSPGSAQRVPGASQGLDTLSRLAIENGGAWSISSYTFFHDVLISNRIVRGYPIRFRWLSERSQVWIDASVLYNISFNYLRKTSVSANTWPFCPATVQRWWTLCFCPTNLMLSSIAVTRPLESLNWLSVE